MYSLVAIACGLVIAIGLHLLLLIEPFLNCKINFTRIKSLLVQFQGCYKDKYRCFASYYMICQLVLLVIMNTNVANIFTLAYKQIAVLIYTALINLIVRPYSSNILNIVDGLILVTMIFVAALQPSKAGNRATANVVNWLAITLLLLPLLIVLGLIVPFIKHLISSYWINVSTETTERGKHNTSM